MNEAYILCLNNETEGECYWSNMSIYANESSLLYGGHDQLPPDLSVISSDSWRTIIIYAIIFIIASTGNLCVLVSVFRRLRVRPSPMNKLLLHLTIADLLVVFIVIPVEIVWRLSIGWYAGDILCKLVQYLRAFGLYLSSLILICISLDRYYVVVHPLKAINSYKRVRVWILLSWCCAALCSSPQVLVFHLENHPYYASYFQCMSKGEFDVVNTGFSLVVMYFLPLFVIVYSYVNIILTIQSQDTPSEGQEASIFLRRSSGCVIERARTRALKLTFVIVLVFLICWTPYVIITLWHMYTTTVALDTRLQDFLFTFVVANSSTNPLVYFFFSRKSSRSRRATLATPSTTVHHRLSSIVTTNAVELRPL